MGWSSWWRLLAWQAPTLEKFDSLRGMAPKLLLLPLLAAALKPHGTVGRRAVIWTPLAFAAAPPPAAAQEDARAYAVRKTEDEWMAALSPTQYYVLRRGGTEPPNSSPLARGVGGREGAFRCAGCGAPLFASADLFESRTGWPSFAAASDNVEVRATAFEAIAGAELRCATCGGHLGLRFSDGAAFPGTRAMRTGRRYCVDGSALVFYPSGDDAAPLSGDVPAATRQGSWQELPAQWNWRMADGGLRPI